MEREAWIWQGTSRLASAQALPIITFFCWLLVKASPISWTIHSDIYRSSKMIICYLSSPWVAPAIAATSGKALGAHGQRMTVSSWEVKLAKTESTISDLDVMMSLHRLATRSPASSSKRYQRSCKRSSVLVNLAVNVMDSCSGSWFYPASFGICLAVEDMTSVLTHWPWPPRPLLHSAMKGAHWDMKMKVFLEPSSRWGGAIQGFEDRFSCEWKC